MARTGISCTSGTRLRKMQAEVHKRRKKAFETTPETAATATVRWSPMYRGPVSRKRSNPPRRCACCNHIRLHSISFHNPAKAKVDDILRQSPRTMKFHLVLLLLLLKSLIPIEANRRIRRGDMVGPIEPDHQVRHGRMLMDKKVGHADT